MQAISFLRKLKNRNLVANSKKNNVYFDEHRLSLPSFELAWLSLRLAETELNFIQRTKLLAIWESSVRTIHHHFWLKRGDTALKQT